IRHRKAECKIYGKSKSYPFYRVCGYVAGKRRMESFATYSAAKAAADKLVRELAKGSQASALTSKQAADALAALERLETFRQSTGRHLSLVGVAAEYCEASAKLDGRILSQVVDGYLSSVAIVKRVDLRQSVEQFIEGRRPKTEAKEGK